ncbi:MULTISPECIES: YtxH domain-containing protein [Porphyromonas]|uniref:YtxH domain-containing protein n=1 Tax=Porphyromonas TaxID=836 RepID=UPI000689BF8A|nr:MULTISPECIES: YtxH domain-containing protein [Porphyromonas]
MKGNGGMKFLIGFAIGAAVGAAAAYFSDEKKRNDFIDDVSDFSDSVKSGVKDAYYGARIRGRKASRDLQRYLADVKDSAEGMYEEVKDKALRAMKS